MNSWSNFLAHKGRRVHKWNHYLPIYDRYLEPFVNKSVTVLEIGVMGGGSLQLWKTILGPYATVVGVDINPRCAKFEEPQIKVRIGSQSDKDFLQKVVEEFGEFDIIIDDGSHMMEDMRVSFDFLYPLLSKNGIYIVEDLHTAYWPEYGGGLRKSDSFIEFAKAKVDELNANWTRGEIPATPFSATTRSISFFDSCVVFERGSIPKVEDLVFGKSKI